MAIGSGIASQIVYKAETTFGVAPSLASVEGLEFKNETLALAKTTVQGQGLHGGSSSGGGVGLYDRAARRVLTNYAASGGITLDLQTRGIGTLLQHMVGSFGQTLAAPTQIGATGIYKSVHWPGSLGGHSLCFQKGVPAVDGTVEPFTYVGCKVTDWEISVATGALAQLVLSLDSRNELAGAGNSDPLNGSVPTLATYPSYGSGLPLSEFHFREATIHTGGTPGVTSGIVSLSGSTAAGNVQSASVKQSHALDVGRYFLGSNGFKAEQIENGFRQITGQLVVEWLSSEAMYNAFAADTTTSLQLTFTGASVSTSNYLLDIIVPNIKFDGEAPKVGGPAVVTQSASFTGLDDESTTPIQIILQNEDVAL